MESTIKIGQVGLGRLGKVHAQNVVNHIPNAELWDLASIVQEELDFAQNVLGARHCYDSYTDIINNDELDASYQYVKALLERVKLGELTSIRCYGIDPHSDLESFISFASNVASGSIFLDMSIHDIELIR